MISFCATLKTSLLVAVPILHEKLAVVNNDANLM